MFLSIVVPLHNEEDTVQHFLATLNEIVSEELEAEYECILVDDGSTDGTWDLLGKLSKRYPIRAFRLSRNFGKEAALCAGLEQANGELTAVMDGDLQHPPELLPKMVQLWKERSCDVVEARKKRADGEPALYKWRAKMFYRLFSRLCGFDLEGLTDFKLLSRRAREAWLQMPERSLFFRGMTSWLGFQREYVEFQVPDIEGRTSRWSTLSLIRYAGRNITAFSTLPLYLLTLAGILFLVPAVGLTIWTLYLKIIGEAVEGIAQIILVLLFSGGLNLMGLSLVGLYLGRIYEETKGRPRYIVRDQCKSSAI